MRSRVHTRKKKADNPLGRMLWVVGGGRDDDESARGEEGRRTHGFSNIGRIPRKP